MNKNKSFMKYLFFAIFSILSFQLFSQELITFKADDGLEITAEIYEVDNNFPYILFFHQANASRGEYKETARKFLKLGYNCMVVDLRSGDEINYVSNETATRAKRQGISNSFLDAEKDIVAAMNYVWEKSPNPMVLVGSSYSASLVLKVAKGNDKVKAVVAFSPGEFLKPQYDVKKGLEGFDKPVLAFGSQREFKYIEEMFSGVDKSLKTVFSPKGGPGDHGAKSIWKSCPESKEYWWELNVFFKRL